MTNSACSVLLAEVDSEIGRRGMEYADAGKVLLGNQTDEAITGYVSGTEHHKVILKLASDRRGVKVTFKHAGPHFQTRE